MTIVPERTLPPTAEEILAAHLGGKLSTGISAPRWPMAGTWPWLTPGVAEVTADRRRPGRGARYTGRTGWSRWSVTARRCSAWATSARGPRCR